MRAMYGMGSGDGGRGGLAHAHCLLLPTGLVTCYEMNGEKWVGKATYSPLQLVFTELHRKFKIVSYIFLCF